MTGPIYKLNKIFSFKEVTIKLDTIIRVVLQNDGNFQVWTNRSGMYLTNYDNIADAKKVYDSLIEKWSEFVN